MPGEMNMQGSQVQQGGREIFFQFILLLSVVLYSRYQRAPVNTGNVEGFHVGKVKVLQDL